ncbi:MAG TPA: hypothetical protein VJ853_14295, partial [Thermoanaerobaculia bacterium]|nr:hypothetical protein [Thermoanaerobaculia bacterium]
MRTGIAAAVLLLLAIVIFVPIALPPAETEPDLSLRSMTHFAFAHQMQSGRDIVYTYGPWAILQQRGFDARTNATVLAVSALLALCFAWGLFRIARDAGANAWAIAAIAVAAAAILAAGGDDARFIAIDLLLLLCLFIDEDSPSREWPLVVAVALLCLIKFSFLIISIFVVAVLALRRRSVAIAIVFIVAFVLADIAALQNPLLIPLMLHRGWQVTSGYAEAASLAAGIGWTMPIAAAGVAALIAIVAIVERRWLPTIAMAGTAWLILKIGYVRQDDTHIRMCGALLPFLFLGYGLLRSRKGIRRVVAVG